MKQRSALFAGLVLTGLVTLGSASGCGSCSKPPPVPLGADGGVGPTGPLAFPPPDEGWGVRSADRDAGILPYLPSSTAIGLYNPKLEAGNRFNVEGQVVRLELDDAVEETPQVTITPAVAGKTVWKYGSQVEFRADAPFDPNVDYTIELPELRAKSGRVLTGGLKAVFRAKPVLLMAGKVVRHVPKAGVVRPVYVRPVDDRDVGPSQQFIVLFDQPTDIETARSLVTITDKDDKPIPLTLSHPPGKDSFEGQKVDTKAVVLAKMTAPPPPDSKITLVARSQKEGEEAQSRKLHIPPLPKFSSVSCYDNCESDGTKVTGTATHVFVAYTNPLRRGAVKNAVSVTPAVANLDAYASMETLGIDGAWTPGTTYQVKVAGLVDRYGFAVPALSFTYAVRPKSAGAILRDGVVVLDEKGREDFYVTGRNVKKGSLDVWTVRDDPDRLSLATFEAGREDKPNGKPDFVFPFTGTADSIWTRSHVDLSTLPLGHAYRAMVRVDEAAGNTSIVVPSSVLGGMPSAPLLLLAGKDAIGAHAHVAGDKILASVYRLTSGEPVTGAEVTYGSAKATTDADGLAIVDYAHTKRGDTNAMFARIGAEQTALPFTDKVGASASELFPALAQYMPEEARRQSAYVGFVITDKGVYRPGSRLRIKALLRKPTNKGLVPVIGGKVRLVVTTPDGGDISDEQLLTGPNGAVNSEIDVPEGGRTGMHRIRLELDDGAHTPVTEERIRVAEFETPRFKVDVTPVGNAPDRFRARITGRYFFGAAMDGATLGWSLTKKPHEPNGGELAKQGLSFVRQEPGDGPWGWYGGDIWSEESPGESPEKKERPVVGHGKLRADGTADVDVALGPAGDRPIEIAFEANVEDASYRHVAAKHTSLVHPHDRYAGLRLSSSFGSAGKLTVSLGVVDTNGKAVAGDEVGARLDRIEWKRITRKAESGAMVEEWKAIPTEAGKCSATAAVAPVSCDLDVPKSGSYRVTARVGGHDDAATTYYAYGSGDPSATPSAGRRIAISTDKKSYAPGETAKVLVQSPFPKATAILALEQGPVVKHEVKRIEGASAVFDLPISLAYAPYVHAVVTLLPVGAPGETFRIGALRVPVAMEDARLAVQVTSAKKMYDAQETADLTVEVKRGAEPVANADVTLAVVDEAILRVTNHHVKDPLFGLHAARSLEFDAYDSRDLLFRKKEKAHTAGGGGAEDGESVDTRRDFVETAAWLTNLVTDAQGRVKASVKLPDNLGEFRMMATVVDPIGRAGVTESSFVVTRPFVLDPLLPAFALRGDKLEIGAMAHNNTDAPVVAKLKIQGTDRTLTIPAKGSSRVVVPLTADKDMDVTVAMDVGGKTVDKAEKHLKIELPGTIEHPQLSGVFGAEQEIVVEVPADAMFEDGAKLTLRTGSALYPELGQRLSYLLDYPHGCVEQTTSSTLPLLAAKNIIAWTGTPGMDDAEIKKRVTAGVKRFASMKTSSGGLAYWPGGYEPHVFGTAYASHALVRAAAMGIKEEKLLEDVLAFLQKQLPQSHDDAQRVAVAEALAQANALPPESADALWDARTRVDVFGKASLALALSTIPKQEDRVRELLDMVESAFDASGAPSSVHGPNDWQWWASSDRDRAQAVIALVKLRPTSKTLPVLTQRLTHRLERYNTQSSAWSLIAVSDFVGPNGPSGSVDVKVREEGRILDSTRKLGGDNKEIAIPLAELRGKKVNLVLSGDASTPSAFAMEAKWTRPGTTSPREGRHAKAGPSIWRVYTDPFGKPIDLAKVKAGDVIRVALRVQVPRLDDWRVRYLAVTDRFGAGFQPVNPDLATVDSAPDVEPVHPFYEGLKNGSSSASHVDLREDRVDVYFDHVYTTSPTYVTYLLRAVTPGEYAVPSARGELMYEPESEGYSDSTKVVIK